MAVQEQGLPALRLSYELHAPPLAGHPARVDSNGVALVLAAALLVVAVSRAFHRPKGRTVPPVLPLDSAIASSRPASVPPRERARGPSARPRVVRSATLEELAELSVSLSWMAKRPFDAEQLLLQHLKRFSHTSPWVLLELRELRQRCAPATPEQQAAEDTEFISRFGVRAPAHGSSRRESGAAEDPQLRRQLVRSWPVKTRQVITHWMLGSQTGQRPSTGMPVLDVQLYRDLLFLYGLLYEVRLAELQQGADFEVTVARDTVDPKRARTVDLELA